jgi:hypothetical protein
MDTVIDASQMDPTFADQIAAEFENEKRVEHGLPAIAERAEDFGEIFAAAGLEVEVESWRSDEYSYYNISGYLPAN